MKIMSSGPITSWEIDGKTVETVSDFTFLGSKITAPPPPKSTPRSFVHLVNIWVLSTDPAHLPCHLPCPLLQGEPHWPLGAPANSTAPRTMIPVSPASGSLLSNVTATGSCREVPHVPCAGTQPARGRSQHDPVMRWVIQLAPCGGKG